MSDLEEEIINSGKQITEGELVKSLGCSDRFGSGDEVVYRKGNKRLIYSLSQGRIIRCFDFNEANYGGGTPNSIRT